MTKIYMVLLIIALMGTLGISTASAQAPAGCVNVITVWDGDTLYSIARERNFSVFELAAVNNIPATTQLRIGDRLCIDGLQVAQEPPLTGGGSPSPGSGSPPPAQPTTSFNFIRSQGPLPAGWNTVNVALGNTLFSISRAINVPVQQLVSVNNITNVNRIFVGETLMYPPANPNTGGNTGGNTNVPVYRPAPGTIPSIGLPGQARAGDSIGVMGSNYPGNTQVDIYFVSPALNLSTGVVQTVTTQPNGTFNELITVPNAFSNGAPLNQLPTVSVSGYARTGGYWAMNYFVVAR